MNRRDAALIAHLDAIESRWTALMTTYHQEIVGRLTAIDAQLTEIREDIAGMKVEHATHRHDDD